MQKLLIVDDSRFMFSVIKNFVEKTGKSVDFLEALNGKEAVDIYAKERPDLVFMDIKMPEMDGLTALELIKRDDPEAKVVMCTSIGDEIAKDKAKTLGALDFVVKPFNSDEIIAAVEKYL